MAEESDLEKTEPPSPRRLEQAREEGQVARSPERGTVSVLATGCAALWLLGDHVAEGMWALMRAAMSFDRVAAFGDQSLIERLGEQGSAGLNVLWPILGVLAISAVIGSLLMNGWLFTFKALEPKVSRLSPLKGFQRMFSLPSLVELGKAIAKATLIGGLAALALYIHAEAFLGLASEPSGAALGHAVRLLIMVVAPVMIGLALIAAIDVPFQIWNHRRKLRMTKDEVKRERKEQEGDPLLKSRIRSLQREAARKRMMGEVPKADVVVTNPVHYAVALSYQEGRQSAPKVVAKGSRLIAARIREIAGEHRVPVVEAPPLARALYHHTEIGDEIPETLYTAVAEVLAYVFQLRRFDAVGGRVPQVPDDLSVPPELDPGAQRQ
jgi:flagellar biosynthetic protein FlhB